MNQPWNLTDRRDHVIFVLGKLYGENACVEGWLKEEGVENYFETGNMQNVGENNNTYLYAEIMNTPQRKKGDRYLAVNLDPKKAISCPTLTHHHYSASTHTS